jgi:hypothetical protein
MADGAGAGGAAFWRLRSVSQIVNRLEGRVRPYVYYVGGAVRTADEGELGPVELSFLLAG